MRRLRSPRTARSAKPRAPRRAFLLAVLPLLSGATGAACSRGAPADPPELPGLPTGLESLEPSVAELVRSTHAALVDAPDQVEAWGRLAMVFEENRLLPHALQSYEGALRLDPEDVRWRYRRAITLSKLDRTEEAVAGMSEVCSLRPDYGAAYWRLGSWQLELGDVPAARETFERGTREASPDPAPWAGLGRVELLDDRPDAAVESLAHALELGPGDPYVEELLATARRARGEEVPPGSGGAVKPLWNDPWEDDLREFRAQTPRMAARVHLLQGKPEEAVRILEAEVERNPDDLLLLSHLAQAQHQAGDSGAALRSLERCIALEPDNIGTYVNLVKVQHETGRPEQALETLDRAIRVRPAYGQLHRYRGELLFELGRFAEAEPALGRAVELDDRDPTTRLYHARALCELGRAPEALAALAPLFAAETHPADAYTVRALAHVVAGDYEDAREALRLAAEAGPEDRSLFVSVQRRLVRDGKVPGGDG